MLFVVAWTGLALYRRTKKTWSRLWKDAVWMGLLCLGLATSYQYLIRGETLVFSEKWSFTLAPALAFPAFVFLKVLAGFWIFHMVNGIANSERIAESGFKLFGVEMSSKMKTDVGVAEARESAELLAWQLHSIDAIQTACMNHVLVLFDHQVANEEDRPFALRLSLQNLLHVIYYERFGRDQYEVFVVPLSQEGYEALGDELSSIVQSHDNGADNICGTFGNIGMSFHRFDDADFDTLIAIRAPADYEMPRAEISAVAMYFIALTKSLEYMPPFGSLS